MKRISVVVSIRVVEDMRGSLQNGIIYLTFGKLSLLTEVLIGSIVLGGASRIGSLPSGIRGPTAGSVAVLCIMSICWMGIRTGEKTLSPTLNSKIYAVAISLIHLVYISIALLLVYLLREPITGLPTNIIQQPLRILALISILTLGYILTVNRLTKMSTEKRDIKNLMNDLESDMNQYRSNQKVSADESVQTVMRIKRLGENIPRSKFPDENRLKGDLNELYQKLDSLDQESTQEIMSEDYVDEEFRADLYIETIIKYDDINERLKKVCQ